MDDLGDLYGLEGRFYDGEHLLKQGLDLLEQTQQALAVARAKRGEDHPNVAATIGNLATVLEAESRFTEAEDAYKKTRAVFEKLYGPSHPLTAIGLNNLANVYADQNRMQDAAGSWAAQAPRMTTGGRPTQKLYAGVQRQTNSRRNVVQL